MHTSAITVANDSPTMPAWGSSTDTALEKVADHSTLALSEKAQAIVDLHVRYVRGGFGTLPVREDPTQSCSSFRD